MPSRAMARKAAAEIIARSEYQAAPVRTPPTPGPWHYETNAQGNVVIYTTRPGHDDKIIIGLSHFGPLEVREANARLICAAVARLFETELAA